MEFYEIDYILSEWRLFTDLSKTSLKGVLLRNEKKYTSISISFSVYLKQNYDNMKIS